MGSLNVYLEKAEPNSGRGGDYSLTFRKERLRPKGQILPLRLLIFFIEMVPFLYTVFSRLNAGGVYLKLSLVDPAFIRTRRLFGARRLFIKCTFQYWKFI